MNEIGIAAAVLSVSTPDTGFLDDPADAAKLARTVNEDGAGLADQQPDRFGHFPHAAPAHVAPSVAEAVRGLSLCWVGSSEFDGLVEAHRSPLGPGRGDALLGMERAGGLSQVGEVRELGRNSTTG